MPRRTALNARQLAVLQRICALGTPVTSADSALAVTVYALRSRGLVTTTWADGQWTAQPTTAGRQYLAGLDPTPTVTAADTQQDRQAALSDTSRTRAVSAAGSAVQLIERIQSSGGTLLITDPTPEERACIRRALHAAKTRHLTPPGHCLRYTGRDKGDLVITLLAGGSPQAASPQSYPVRVPSELAPEQLHAAVRDIPLPVCPSCQDRARRLLHALSTAAEREHFTLSACF